MHAYSSQLKVNECNWRRFGDLFIIL